MAQFVDRVTVRLKAGNGGNGCASIRREKFKPLAGPNGGNGGNGGSIYFRATDQCSSLLDYHFSARKTAGNGEMGYGDYKDGKRGEDIHLPVPLGTEIKTTGGEIIVDMTTEGQEFLAVQGGVGGLGNEDLASKQRKAPGFALLGLPGEEAELVLELKLLADVALVGFPSAGKSSIIAAISAARPKIADYPFTTLTPNLGVVQSRGETFTVADVPGLIPGASEGKGLGHEFLRHIERTRAIVHVIDVATYEPGRDPITDLKVIEDELRAYSPELADRPKLVALNKTDNQAAFELAELAKEQLEEAGYEVFLTSAKSHEGLKNLVSRMGELVAMNSSNLTETTARENEGSTEGEPVEIPFNSYAGDNSAREVIRLTPLKRKNDNHAQFEIVQHGEREKGNLWWEVVGEKTRRFVLQTDMDNDEAVGYLADRLAKVGVEEALQKAGAQAGDDVRISVKNNRASYLKTEQDAFMFDFAPELSAGAEQLYSFRRGEDARLEYEDRANRATRREKREDLERKRAEWAIAAEEFNRAHSSGLV